MKRRVLVIGGGVAIAAAAFLYLRRGSAVPEAVTAGPSVQTTMRPYDTDAPEFLVYNLPPYRDPLAPGADEGAGRGAGALPPGAMVPGVADPTRGTGQGGAPTCGCSSGLQSAVYSGVNSLINSFAEKVRDFEDAYLSNIYSAVPEWMRVQINNPAGAALSAQSRAAATTFNDGLKYTFLRG